MSRPRPLLCVSKHVRLRRPPLGPAPLTVRVARARAVVAQTVTHARLDVVLGASVSSSSGQRNSNEARLIRDASSDGSSSAVALRIWANESRVVLAGCLLMVAPPSSSAPCLGSSRSVTALRVPDHRRPKASDREPERWRSAPAAAHRPRGRGRAPHLGGRPTAENRCIPHVRRVARCLLT